MKAKCLDSEGFRFLTRGKIYEIHSVTRDFVFIINDSGVTKRYGKNRFKLIEDESKVEKPKVEEKPKEKLVVCKIPSHGSLEYNKKYKVLSEDENNFLIKDEGGTNMWFSKKRFE